MALNEEQIQAYDETFLIFDNSGDKKISVNQIGNALRAIGLNPTEGDVKKCQENYKPEQRIGFDEFLPMIQMVIKKENKYSIEEFIDGLKNFDSDSSGYISSAEMRQLLTGLGEKMKDEEVEQLLAGVEDEEGRINYDYFVRQVVKE